MIRARRGDANRLGIAIQLCYFHYPGRIWRAEEEVPSYLQEYVGKQLDIDPRKLEDYGKARIETRREHIRELHTAFNYEAFGEEHHQELFDWLLPIAMPNHVWVYSVSLSDKGNA